MVGAHGTKFSIAFLKNTAVFRYETSYYSCLHTVVCKPTAVEFRRDPCPSMPMHVLDLHADGNAETAVHALHDRPD
eukprot:SAG31_NODE_4421_length_3249_cov_2.958730_4_plen_76_part_00